MLKCGCLSLSNLYSEALWLTSIGCFCSNSLYSIVMFQYLTIKSMLWYGTKGCRVMPMPFINQMFKIDFYYTRMANTSTSLYLHQLKWKFQSPFLHSSFNENYKMRRTNGITQIPDGILCVGLFLIVSWLIFFAKGVLLWPKLTRCSPPFIQLQLIFFSDVQLNNQISTLVMYPFL